MHPPAKFFYLVFHNYRLMATAMATGNGNKLYKTTVLSSYYACFIIFADMCINFKELVRVKFDVSNSQNYILELAI